MRPQRSHLKRQQSDAQVWFAVPSHNAHTTIPIFPHILTLKTLISYPYLSSHITPHQQITLSPPPHLPPYPSLPLYLPSPTLPLKIIKYTLTPPTIHIIQIPIPTQTPTQPQKHTLQNILPTIPKPQTPQYPNFPPHNSKHSKPPPPHQNPPISNLSHPHHIPLPFSLHPSLPQLLTPLTNNPSSLNPHPPNTNHNQLPSHSTSYTSHSPPNSPSSSLQSPPPPPPTSHLHSPTPLLKLPPPHTPPQPSHPPSTSPPLSPPPPNPPPSSPPSPSPNYSPQNNPPFIPPSPPPPPHSPSPSHQPSSKHPTSSPLLPLPSQLYLLLSTQPQKTSSPSTLPPPHPSSHIIQIPSPSFPTTPPSFIHPPPPFPYPPLITLNPKQKF